MRHKRTHDLDVGRRASSRLWWSSQASYHQLYISPEVVRELSAPTFPQQLSALQMLEGLESLDLDEEVVALAELLVREKIIPGPAVSGDSLHLAVSIVHDMDYLLTWNVKHLANPNKRTHLAVLCMRLGFTAPILATPDLLQELDHEEE